MSTFSLLTSLRGEHRVHFGQLGDVVVCVNGHDPNKIVSLRSFTGYSLGLAAPGAAPTGSVGSAGNPNGAYRYRARWKDNLAGTVSLPSAELSVTISGTKYTVTAPGSPPARATHWILERTTAGGALFWPVNLAAATPDGTVIGTTTYEDNTSDASLAAAAVLRYQDRQGVPRPYRMVAVVRRRVFLGGRRVHKPSCVLTKTNTAVTSADGGFLADMVGQELSVPGDADGKSYQISAVGGANALTLGSAYAGESGTKVAWISGPPDWIAWSEANAPEEYGAAVVGGWSGLSNELRIGDDGEPITGLVGLGDAGLLVTKEAGQWLLRYVMDPDPVAGDGRVLALPTRRGCVGPLALKFHEGLLYGIDRLGVWRMAPGGLPEEIGGPINIEWRRNALGFTYADNWHVQHDPRANSILVFLTEGTDVYPKLAYEFSLNAQRWTGSRRYPVGVGCAVELPDDEEQPALAYAQEKSGSGKSFFWMAGIGSSLGAPAATSPLSGTATGGDTTTVTDSTATWPVTGDRLKGVAVAVTHISGVRETGIVASNTATAITLEAALTAACAAGDTYEIGPIEAVVETGRIHAGHPDRKKVWKGVWLWVRYNATASALKVRAFFDGSSTPHSDRVVAADEDGVQWAASGSDVKVDPTLANAHRYWVPLDGVEAVDVALQLWSTVPGRPWEVLAMRVVAEVDDAVVPRKR